MPQNRPRYLPCLVLVTASLFISFVVKEAELNKSMTESPSIHAQILIPEFSNTFSVSSGRRHRDKFHTQINLITSVIQHGWRTSVTAYLQAHTLQTLFNVKSDSKVQTDIEQTTNIGSGYLCSARLSKRVWPEIFWRNITSIQSDVESWVIKVTIMSKPQEDAECM